MDAASCFRWSRDHSKRDCRESKKILPETHKFVDLPRVPSQVSSAMNARRFQSDFLIARSIDQMNRRSDSFV